MPRFWPPVRIDCADACVAFRKSHLSYRTENLPSEVMSLPTPLIEHILRRRGAITKTWLAALWKSPEFTIAKDIPPPELIDHIPDLFDELAEYLRTAEAPQAEHKARVHGQYRWQQQFRLDEVLRELLLIRDIIIAEIERYLAEHEPSAANVLLEARRRVGRFFDDVLLYSASQFAEQQQAQTEEDKRVTASQSQGISSELQALGSTRLRLLRTIAHDLGNMLSAAMLASKSLFAKQDPESRMELQQVVSRCHRQMAALVNQLLEMAPLLAHRESLRLAPLDMQAFASEQLSLFEQMATYRQLTFQCELGKGLGDVISDEAKLQRIVTNLVQNALKYTPPGGSIELRFEALDPQRWLLSVKDTGRGIPKEHRTKVFEEFYRVPGAQQQGEGTGLGLSIVRQLVSLLKGEISLESAVGRGSTFSITLPRDPREGASDGVR